MSAAALVIHFSASRVDLDLDKGATAAFLVVWREPAGPGGTPGAAIAFDGYSARMQIRETYAAASHLAELTLGAGLTLATTVAGEPALRLRLGADVTAALTDLAVYDLELTDVGDPTEVVRLMGGRVLAGAEVTR